MLSVKWIGRPLRRVRGGDLEPADAVGLASRWPYLHLYITQLDDPPRQKRLISEWCELLPTMTHIRHLDFGSRTTQAMFDAACSMPQLERLSISWSGINDLSRITSMTNLCQLSIGPSGGIRSIEPLASLTNLKTLHLEYFSSVTDFTPLSNLTELRDLSIDGAMGKPQKVDSLTPLSGLRNLRSLSLRNTQVLDKSFSPLLSLTELRTFYSAWTYPRSEFDKLLTLPNLRRPDRHMLDEYARYMSKR